MENKSIVVDYINELVHGGPGSGRWPKGSTGNTPGSRTFFKKYEKKPKVVFTSADSYASKKHTTTYNSNPKTSNKQSKPTSNSTSAPSTKETNKNEPLENKPKVDKKSVSLEGVNQLARSSSEAARNAKSTVDAIPVKKNRINVDKMSNKELQDYITRMSLENQYNQLYAQPSKAEKAKSVVSTILGVGGGVLATTASALSIVIAIRDLKKKK